MLAKWRGTGKYRRPGEESEPDAVQYATVDRRWMANGPWYKNPLVDLMVGIAVAGTVGWASAFVTTRDYVIKDEQRHAETQRRLREMEHGTQEITNYLRTIDQRLSRIEGKLGIGIP